MANNRFYGKAKYVPETEQCDDDLTQADSPPSNKRINLEEHVELSFNDSQEIFTEPQNEPSSLHGLTNSQKWTSYSEEMAKYDKEDIATMTDDNDYNKSYKEIGTMTESGFTCTNNTSMEIRCNEFFGSVVACELANYHGQARYNKMKAIIEIFNDK